MTGFTVALGVVLVYYVLLTIIEAIGENWQISPFITAWSANFIMGSLGLYVYYRAAKDMPLMFVARISEMGNILYAPFKMIAALREAKK